MRSAPKRFALTTARSVALLLALNALCPCDAFETRQAAPGVFYGPMPASPADWHDIVQQGVRTVVSVDGLPPDAGSAQAVGLRVYHVPLGYDGLSDTAVRQLASIARDTRRPLYVYCHHGHHRGPTAAAIICQTLGLLDHASATALLVEAGTSPAYAGLWHAVANYQPPAIGEPTPTLVSRAEVGPLALAMAQLDRGWDAYRNASTEAARTVSLVTIREALRESQRASVTNHQQSQLLPLLHKVAELQEQLAIGSTGVDRKSIEDAFGAACVSCHRAHRD